MKDYKKMSELEFLNELWEHFITECNVGKDHENGLKLIESRIRLLNPQDEFFQRAEEW